MLSAVVRKEYKGPQERRTPLTPAALYRLKQQGFTLDVESSKVRVYADDAYRQLGVSVVESSQNEQLVIGIKEPPLAIIQPGQVHLAFSHTIKGQSRNMPLLRAFLERRATLIDYELFLDEQGKRTIAFGYFAGIAGAVDTLWIAGQKWQQQGRASSLSQLIQCIHYESLMEVQHALESVDVHQGEPIRVLILGYGNVGRGCEQVCRWLGLPEVSLEDMKSGRAQGSCFSIAHSQDVHRARDAQPFDSKEYKRAGKQKYDSCFNELLGCFNILMHATYWDDHYPRHLTKERMLAYRDSLPIVIGDITCDIEGSLACTKRASSIEHPVYTYDLDQDTVADGIGEQGIAVLAVDNLPCELPHDASDYFSSILVRYVPELMQLDLSQPLSSCGLSPCVQHATIVYNGALTEKYQYLQTFLS